MDPPRSATRGYIRAMEPPRRECGTENSDRPAQGMVSCCRREWSCAQDRQLCKAESYEPPILIL